MAKKASGASSGKSLIIVESFAKTKTIKKFLGRDYVVKASKGHVRDLVSGKGKTKAKAKTKTKGKAKKKTKATDSIRFGIDFAHGYRPIYQNIPASESIIEGLKKAAEECDTVYLAPDPDREGEAIAWHLTEALHLPAEKTHRVTFNSITKSAVTEALENARDVDMNLVNAQQARRVLDRIVGFSLSPLLWKKVTKGLSAGRVQSVAVRMVVEREKEIRAFVPEEFWRITAILAKQAGGQAENFQALLSTWKGAKVWQGQKDWKGDKTGGPRTEEVKQCALPSNSMRGSTLTVRLQV
ncbi:MAG: DNA topoisomerase [Planctomycetota bacterium]|jgi:DNA topoisomerase-1